MTETNYHIADGDSTAGTLRQAGFARKGVVLSWRDALYSGPVPNRLTHRQLSRLRSRFWTDGKSSREFDKRDQLLNCLRDNDEVVLWFAKDCVLCILSFVQVLCWLREQRSRTQRITWVPQHGAILGPGKVAEAYLKRKKVTGVQLKLAEKAWRAFRSPSPVALVGLRQDDPSGIPGLKKATEWILQEYPSKGNGLSQLQRTLLNEIGKKDGNSKVSMAIASVLTTEFVGDSFLFDLLRRTVEVEKPLATLLKTGDADPTRLSYRSHIALTELGRRVLARKADHVALNGVDYWLGGVHLRGKNMRWRWDTRLRNVVSV